FYAPPGSKGIQVNATAPQGMPIRTAPSPAGQPDTYKIAFPIKPGETTFHINYSVPFSSPGPFEGKLFYRGAATSLIAPPGVTIKGEGITVKGTEPRTKATVYQTTEASFKVQIEGAGELNRGGEPTEAEPGGPQIQFVLPKLYNKLYWVLALAFSILTLGFVLLYRAGRAEPASQTQSQPRASARGLKKK